MNALQFKMLRDSGIPESAIFVIEEITQAKQAELSTKQDLEVTKLELQKQIETTKLELQKQIEVVRKDGEANKLELQREIEVVRKEIQELKVDLHKSMNSQIWKIILLLISILSPLYVMAIRILLQLSTFSK